MLQVGASPEELGLLPRYIARAGANPSVVIGLGCAVGAAAAWLLTVARAELSYVYPFMGLAIVLVLAVSGLLFDEVVSIRRWAGVIVVCLGLILASRS
jgi:drug/metabolite transporter (DMT)-like permease